jgi:hypothetical protein
MCTQAVEVLFKMAAQRKIITPLYNGEVNIHLTKKKAKF